MHLISCCYLLFSSLIGIFSPRVFHMQKKPFNCEVNSLKENLLSPLRSRLKNAMKLVTLVKLP